jgi:hypothetical protein
MTDSYMICIIMRKMHGIFTTVCCAPSAGAKTGDFEEDGFEKVFLLCSVQCAPEDSVGFPSFI